MDEFAILADENIAAAVSQQLTARQVTNERLINVLPEGTPDPDVLAFAHAEGYVLLTHDQSIVAHVKRRMAQGNDHAGVLVAVEKYQGPSGIGTIVAFVTELDDFIKGGAATVADDVYNQIIYID